MILALFFKNAIFTDLTLKLPFDLEDDLGKINKIFSEIDCPIKIT